MNTLQVGGLGILTNLYFFYKLESILSKNKYNKADINYIYSTIHALTVSIFPLLYTYNFISLDSYLCMCLFSTSYGIYDVVYVYNNNLGNITQRLLHHMILIIATSKCYLGYYGEEFLYLFSLNLITEITTPTLNIMLYLNSNKLIIKYPTLFRASAIITCINFFIFRILNGIYINYNLYYSPYINELLLQMVLTTMNFIWFYKLIIYKDRKSIMANSNITKIKDNIDKVFSLYEKYGDNNYIGEEVSQVEHATQAALLASEMDLCNKPDIILGAFLHDIGHLLVFENKHIERMGDLGALEHELVGCNYLTSLGFPERTCEIVRNHINTKRYLITKHPQYYDNLSDASKQTFKYQGGNMSEKELSDFQLDENFRIHLNIRQFDDNAKDTSLKMLEKIKELDPINFYKKMALDLLIDTTK